MVSKEKQRKISKRLSYVLRHAPESVGLSLGDGGWIDVTELQSALASNGLSVDLETLKTVVVENDKQRFEFNEDETEIRARQGHSVDVALGYEPTEPPEFLYQGTATRFLESIFREGLKKQSRHDVHLSTNHDMMLSVGSRHGSPVILSVHAKRMHDAGFKFFLTGNNVWLTDHVPPEYIEPIEK